MKKLLRVFSIFVVFCLLGCSILDEPNSYKKSNEPSFNPHINPNASYEYKNSGFVKFYESFYLADSLKECYKNMPELFLQAGEEPMLVNSVDNGKEFIPPNNFSKRYEYILIGISSYASNFYGEAQEALEVAKVLRAKYVGYGTRLLNEYDTVQGQKVQRKAMEAVFLIGMPKNEFSFETFAQKCPLLDEELYEKFQKRNKK
ncbi:hypothetical protein DMB92_04575 [Campylobacter sp. MIT 99-7217]|uniref:hypothetical protein n=1 Tax=Campylobacter sp. MIT 99-7217 TaxID=535091 RepID=UPI00115B0632|nr:hypothetical protein [Campylobacter sp. MIT 99-7217]TQR32378.1 hypothetical protein DMB92_04575 [Campylobacter sp. MIT 99-7217]